MKPCGEMIPISDLAGGRVGHFFTTTRFYEGSILSPSMIALEQTGP